MERPLPDGYISVDDAAKEAGFRPHWIRAQIRAGRLPATVWVTGERRTYRIARADWHAFMARYSGPADDPRFTDEGPDDPTRMVDR